MGDTPTPTDYAALGWALGPRRWQEAARRQLAADEAWQQPERLGRQLRRRPRAVRVSRRGIRHRRGRRETRRALQRRTTNDADGAVRFRPSAFLLPRRRIPARHTGRPRVACRQPLHDFAGIKASERQAVQVAARPARVRPRGRAGCRPELLRDSNRFGYPKGQPGSHPERRKKQRTYKPRRRDATQRRQRSRHPRRTQSNTMRNAATRP